MGKRSGVNLFKKDLRAKYKMPKQYYVFQDTLLIGVSKEKPQNNFNPKYQFAEISKKSLQIAIKKQSNFWVLIKMRILC